ncbi:MAG: sugar diacid utilization regulator [Actinoallomurus sp.]|jgi:sugar diacid utilization regulator|nr:sugar diacid utilization regulator [Actinoallomurus sp.]
MPITPESPPDPALRDQLSGMRSLLALSMVMSESDDQGHILGLAATAVPSLGRYRLEGVYLADGGWQAVPGVHAASDARGDLEAQFAVLSVAGGPVAVLGQAWAWAYPLRSLDGHLGYLVVSAEGEPPSSEQFLLRVLAQQAGIAIAGARQRARRRADAERLHAANAALAETVAELELTAEVHERLTRVAAAGGGPEGIAIALHELTGYPIAVEDRYGNLRAWAGPRRPDPYPKEPWNAREEMLNEVSRDPRPIRRDGRIIVPAGPRDDVLGVLVLIDPGESAGRPEQAALQHAATVLALELAHLHNVAEAELRLGRDLVEELLSGAGEETMLARADALGYDLRRPHRIVVVIGPAEDGFGRAVGVAVRETGIGSLFAVRGREAVVLSDADRPWSRFHTVVRRELGGGLCRVGVGGAYERPRDLPRSYHEARLALRLQSAVTGDQATEFDRLGVYRLLADVAEPGSVERFVREWLGALLDYDAAKGSELVTTLTRYLECGRSYEATTTALAIHRSTLKYRLRRIKEISGHDLADPDTYFNLQLASRAWNTLRALRAAHH